MECLETRRLLSATPYGATSQDTGEFMLGTVLVTPVFLESTGEIDPSTEDWTAELIEETKAIVQEGIQWWEETLENFSSVHSLDFIFDFTYADEPVPTRYEPISRPSNDFELWVNEFLDYTGYQSPETLHIDIREFNHAQREAHGADWAFTIFVVNSANDADGQFAPGGSFSRAFAFAGGRFFVAPSTRPAQTFAHETGHMFWARDEYLGGGSYLDYRGYYDTQNWNAVNNTTSGFVHQPSIMASGASLEFAYQTNTSAPSALEMIGWRDSNGNGIFDVLDVPHELEGIGYFDPSISKYRFEGEASVGTLPNRNPSGLQNDITINRITRAEYRIEGGSWQPSEQYNTHTAQLDLRIEVPLGRHLIEIRTITLDPVTQQFIASSPIFSGWSDETTASPRHGIQGFVWNDVNADGEWDPREIGLAGRVVQLVDDQGDVLPGQQFVEPDDYTNEVVLNHVQAGVTLRATGINVTSNDVYSRVHETASTGSRVFAFRDPLGTSRPTWFRDGSELHVQFDTPQSYVRIDAIGAGGPSSGRLEAYDSAGNLLARYNTDLLDLGKVETMTIARSAADIASIKAFGRSLQPVLLDHLRWGVPVQATVDPNGSYRFTGLTEGTYRVETVVPAGATVVTPADGSYQVTLEENSITAGLNFAVHPERPWQNPLNRFDVNGDGVVNPFDVLILVSEILANPQTELPFPSADRSPPNYVDVSGTGQLTPFDALLVVSHLVPPPTNNQRSVGGAESSESEAPEDVVGDWTPLSVLKRVGAPLSDANPESSRERPLTERPLGPPLRPRLSEPDLLTAVRPKRDRTPHSLVAGMEATWGKQVDAVVSDARFFDEVGILDEVCGLKRSFDL